MHEDLQLAGMSQRTVHGYLRAVRQLADWAETPPDKITERQLRQYFLYLKNVKQFAYGSIRVAFSGIKLYYTRTCKRSWETLATMKLQHAKTLPEVLTMEQVRQIVSACRVERIAVPRAHAKTQRRKERGQNNPSLTSLRLGDLA